MSAEQPTFVSKQIPLAAPSGATVCVIGTNHQRIRLAIGQGQPGRDYKVKMSHLLDPAGAAALVEVLKTAVDQQALVKAAADAPRDTSPTGQPGDGWPNFKL
jgi:hypothetical protein